MQGRAVRLVHMRALCAVCMRVRGGRGAHHKIPHVGEIVNGPLRSQLVELHQHEIYDQEERNGENGVDQALIRGIIPALDVVRWHDRTER